MTTAELQNLRRSYTSHSLDEKDVLPGAVEQFTKWFEEAVKQAGIIDLCWLDLRHTFASRLAMAGVALRTIAERLVSRAVNKGPIPQTLELTHRTY